MSESDHLPSVNNKKSDKDGPVIVDLESPRKIQDFYARQAERSETDYDDAAPVILQREENHGIDNRRPSSRPFIPYYRTSIKDSSKKCSAGNITTCTTKPSSSGFLYPTPLTETLQVDEYDKIQAKGGINLKNTSGKDTVYNISTDNIPPMPDLEKGSKDFNLKTKTDFPMKLYPSIPSLIDNSRHGAESSPDWPNVMRSYSCSSLSVQAQAREGEKKGDIEAEDCIANESKISRSRSYDLEAPVNDQPNSNRCSTFRAKVQQREEQEEDDDEDLACNESIDSEDSSIQIGAVAVYPNGVSMLRQTRATITQSSVYPNGVTLLRQTRATITQSSPGRYSTSTRNTISRRDDATEERHQSNVPDPPTSNKGIASIICQFRKELLTFLIVFGLLFSIGFGITCALLTYKERQGKGEENSGNVSSFNANPALTHTLFNSDVNNAIEREDEQPSGNVSSFIPGTNHTF